MLILMLYELTECCSQGTISDDVCSEGNPCKNGKCVNTFNDFECICEFSWTGRTCGDKDHCALDACPRDLQCSNFEAGFICNHLIYYLLNSFRPLFERFSILNPSILDWLILFLRLLLLQHFGKYHIFLN